MDCAMEDARLRHPSALDVLALATVIVVGLVVSQYSPIGIQPRTWDFSYPGNLFLAGVHKARHALNAAAPVGFGLAVVGFARVLREPRPRRRRLFRQPGVAACAAIAAALAAGAVNTAVWVVRWLEFHEEWLSPRASMFFTLAGRHVSDCVLGAWAFLALGGLWSPGRNWVNRLGWALGVLALVNTVLWCLP
jgi:hypothetical protein